MVVSKAIGISRTTIYVALKEIELSEENKLEVNRVRRHGGGRKDIVKNNPGIEEELENLVEGVTRGNPESLLKWTAKSTHKLAEELTCKGYRIAKNTTGRLLKKLGYSLQRNRKNSGGKNHPDRNAQFEYINEKSKSFLNKGLPVISVDAKKKEIIGNYKNNGVEYSKIGKPIKVNTHDFPDPKP